MQRAHAWALVVPLLPLVSLVTVHAGCSSSSTPGAGGDGGADTSVADANGGADSNVADANGAVDAGGDTSASNDGSAALDGSPLTEDAGYDTIPDGALSTPPDDACAPVVISGRVPKNHRATGTTCPTQRGAGNVSGLESTCGYDAGAVACIQDTDCTAGNNGRCIASSFPPIPCPTPVCSYDPCSTDSECPGSVACECRSSGSDDSPNVCAVGSDCGVDSDCGPGGYCSPGGFTDAFCSNPTYFCHTGADTCIDDSDCCGETCRFDGTLGHFACGTGCVPPP